jgi:hypothetical protein
VRKHQGTLDRLALASYAREIPADQYERVRALAAQQWLGAQEQCKKAEAKADRKGGRELGARRPAHLVERLGSRLRRRASVRGEAPDLNGHRRKVRAMVERVVLGPEGPSVVLALGGAASLVQETCGRAVRPPMGARSSEARIPQL